MTFSIVIANLVFGFTSIILAVWFIDIFRKPTELEKIAKNLGVQTINWTNIFIVIANWIVSGVYLFG